MQEEKYIFIEDYFGKEIRVILVDTWCNGRRDKVLISCEDKKEIWNVGSKSNIGYTVVGDSIEETQVNYNEDNDIFKRVLSIIDEKERECDSEYTELSLKTLHICILYRDVLVEFDLYIKNNQIFSDEIITKQPFSNASIFIKEIISQKKREIDEQLEQKSTKKTSFFKKLTLRKEDKKAKKAIYDKYPELARLERN